MASHLDPTLTIFAPPRHRPPQRRFTGREARRWTLGLGCVALAAACTAQAPQAESFASQDAAKYGVVAAPPLPVSAPDEAFDPSVEIANVDGSVVVSAAGAAVVFSDSVDTLPPVPVAGAAELRAVSATGGQVALFDELDGGRSRISVVDRRGQEPVVDTYELDGLVEPEAFSTDGSLLYVIDHQAASAPGAYRVRPLDLETGRLETIVGPSKAPFDEDMNGVGRRQVWGAGGARLYTLYIRQTHQHHSAGHHDDAHHDNGHDGHHDDASGPTRGGTGTDGFVHVLDLDEEWAFCLDLPAAFGAGDLDTTALAVSPDGSTIAVADATAGQVAFASTTDLEVTRTAPMADFAIDADLQIGMTTEDLIFGAGSELRWFDQETMMPLHDDPIDVAARVDGITSSGASALVWTAPLVSAPIEVSRPSGSGDSTQGA